MSNTPELRSQISL